MSKNEDAPENLGALHGSVALPLRPDQTVQLGEAVASERDIANPNVLIVTRWESASEAN